MVTDKKLERSWPSEKVLLLGPSAAAVAPQQCSSVAKPELTLKAGKPIKTIIQLSFQQDPDIYERGSLGAIGNNHKD